MLAKRVEINISCLFYPRLWSYHCLNVKFMSHINKEVGRQLPYEFDYLTY